jgi:hypothetical protein
MIPDWRDVLGQLCIFPPRLVLTPFLVVDMEWVRDLGSCCWFGHLDEWDGQIITLDFMQDKPLRNFRIL